MLNLKYAFFLFFVALSVRCCECGAGSFKSESRCRSLFFCLQGPTHSSFGSVRHRLPEARPKVGPACQGPSAHVVDLGDLRSAPVRWRLCALGGHASGLCCGQNFYLMDATSRQLESIKNSTARHPSIAASRKSLCLGQLLTELKHDLDGLSHCSKPTAAPDEKDSHKFKQKVDDGDSTKLALVPYVTFEYDDGLKKKKALAAAAQALRTAAAFFAATLGFTALACAWWSPPWALRRPGGAGLAAARPFASARAAGSGRPGVAGPRRPSSAASCSTWVYCTLGSASFISSCIRCCCEGHVGLLDVVPKPPII